jgi:hypothetical protein
MVDRGSSRALTLGLPRVAFLLKLVSNTRRLYLLMILADGETDPHRLSTAVGQPVGNHLAALRQGGLISCRPNSRSTAASYSVTEAGVWLLNVVADLVGQLPRDRTNFAIAPPPRLHSEFSVSENSLHGRAIE